MTTAVPVKPKKPRYPATVKRAAHLTPRMVRITFTSPGSSTSGGTARPRTSSSSSLSPRLRRRGPKSRGPRCAPYTPRRLDRETRELDVDFILHGEGPGLDLGRNRPPSARRFQIGGPGRNYVIDPTADWFLIAGDDTAIPAISTILESLPASAAAHVFIEVNRPDGRSRDLQRIRTPP